MPPWTRRRSTPCCSTRTSAGPATPSWSWSLEQQGVRGPGLAIHDYADLQGNGYVAYQRRPEESGLENQCWKDSWDSISDRDGRFARLPSCYL